MTQRQDILKKLLRFEGSLSEIQHQLRQFDWDSEDELAVLRRSDIASILDRNSQGLLSAGDLEDWANTIEGRDDIGYEAGYGDLIHEVIFELANPELNAPLTRDVVERLRLAVKN